MQARWTTRGPGQVPPTALLVHGILGNRRNMQSFGKMIAEVGSCLAGLQRGDMGLVCGVGHACMSPACYKPPAYSLPHLLRSPLL